LISALPKTTGSSVAFKPDTHDQMVKLFASDHTRKNFLNNGS